MTQGIYIVKNLINGKRYIGQSVNIETRFKQHILGMTQGKHHNKAMQKDFDEQGADAFALQVAEVIEDKDQLREAERLWIEEIKPEYNFDPDVVRRWKEGMEAAHLKRHGTKRTYSFPSNWPAPY